VISPSLFPSGNFGLRSKFMHSEKAQREANSRSVVIIDGTVAPGYLNFGLSVDTRFRII